MTREYVAHTSAKVVQIGNITHRITVNDRAATRATIFRRITAAGFPAIERSEWTARKVEAELDSDWDYSMISIHHAGRAFICDPGALQMKDVEAMHLKQNYGDVGYHFGIDCSGFIFEGRDIRFKGSHMLDFNTGAIGIVLLENLATVEEGGDLYAKVRTGVRDSVGYDATRAVPARQLDATLALIQALKSVFNISVLGAHREFPFQGNKICPGNVGLELVKVLRTKMNFLAPPTS